MFFPYSGQLLVLIFIIIGILYGFSYYRPYIDKSDICYDTCMANCQKIKFTCQIYKTENYFCDQDKLEYLDSDQIIWYIKPNNQTKYYKLPRSNYLELENQTCYFDGQNIPKFSCNCPSWYDKIQIPIITIAAIIYIYLVDFDIGGPFLIGFLIIHLMLYSITNYCLLIF